MIKVTGMNICARSGHNGCPVSGDVTFSDGKQYGWLRLSEGGIRFSGSRKGYGARVGLFCFSSTKREAALVVSLSAA